MNNKELESEFEKSQRELSSFIGIRSGSREAKDWKPIEFEGKEKNQ